MKIQVELSEWGLATIIGIVEGELRELRDRERKFRDPTGNRASVICSLMETIGDLRAGKSAARNPDFVQ